MLFQNLISNAGVATVLLSSGVLAGPVGPFGRLVRDSKAHLRGAAGNAEHLKERDGGSSSSESTSMRYLNSQTSGKSFFWDISGFLLTSL
jgi:hypothetical protein